MDNFGGSIVTVFLLFLVIVIAAYGFAWFTTPYGPNFIVKAKVKAVSYKPHTSSSGFGMTSEGETIYTSNNSPEEYTVVLNLLEKKELLTLNDEDLYANVEAGDLLDLTMHSKTVWYSTDTKLVSWEKVK